MLPRLLAFAGCVLLGSLTPAPAQTTSTPADGGADPVEVHAAADEPEPASEPSTIEKLRTFVEDKGIVDRLTHGDGFYPRIGGLTTGSGLAGGVGYRTHLPGGVFADLSGVISTKNYKGLDAQVRWATAWNGRLEFWSAVRWRDYTQEDFYGVGSTSLSSTRVNYAYRSTDINGRVVANVRRWLKTGVEVGRLSPTIGPGHDDLLPTIGALFTDAIAPGLDAQPSFLYTTLFAEADYRDQPGNPHRGGYVRASWGSWDDRTLQQFDFDRFDAEAAHFVPVTPRQVIALHTGLAYLNNAPGERVPFYMLPYIGGSDTLRGFDEFRFRDENAFYLNGEYRVDVREFLEAVGFVDAGEVRANWEEIGPAGLTMSYGGGVRVKTKKQVFLRFDVGTTGHNSGQIFLKFGKSF